MDHMQLEWLELRFSRWNAKFSILRLDLSFWEWLFFRHCTGHWRNTEHASKGCVWGFNSFIRTGLNWYFMENKSIESNRPDVCQRSLKGTWVGSFLKNGSSEFRLFSTNMDVRRSPINRFSFRCRSFELFGAHRRYIFGVSPPRSKSAVCEIDAQNPMKPFQF